MAEGSLISFPRRRPSRLDTYGQERPAGRAPEQSRGPTGETGAPSRHDPAILAAFDKLSKREWDVLWLLAEGLSDRDIAARLGIGKETVRTHMAGLLGKLGAESRLQALVLAVRHGQVTIR